MIWRWIFGVFGGVVVLQVAARALAQVYRDRPLSTVIGTALVVVVLVVLGAALIAEDRGGRMEVRRASAESVDHVVHHVVHHHVVEHVHRLAGEASTVDRAPRVVDGTVTRAIEGRST